MLLSPVSKRRRQRAGVAVLSLAAAAAALAGPSFPSRKAGLWEMRMSGVAGPGGGMVVQHCIDAATDKAMQEFGASQPKMNRKACQEEMRNEAGKLLVHRTVCKEGTDTVTSNIVVSGDFDSSYRVQSTTTYDPPRKAGKEIDVVVDAKWLGACAAGQKPGDMVMPGGMKMNIVDMMKRMPAGPRK
jgi:hypothetical protein